MIFFFLQIYKYINFFQRNTIDKDEKIHFYLDKNVSSFYPEKFTGAKTDVVRRFIMGKSLFYFSFGSYSEFLGNILIHIDCSLSIQRSFWNFSLIKCMFILFLIVFYVYQLKEKNWKELFTYMYCFTYSLTSPIIFIEPIP